MGGGDKSTFVNLGGGKSWWGEITEGEKVGGNLGRETLGGENIGGEIMVREMNKDYDDQGEEQFICLEMRRPSLLTLLFSSSEIMYFKGSLGFTMQNALFLGLDIIAVKLLCQRFRRQNTWFADQYKFFTVVHGEHDDPSEVRGSTLFEPNPTFSTQPVLNIELYKTSREWTKPSIQSLSRAEYLVSLV